MNYKRSLFFILCGFAALVLTSCKKDYQKLSTEFIRNLSDSCEFLVQVENDVEHLVYYKEVRNDVFYCYNLDTENREEIIVPKVEQYLGKPVAIGAGSENIAIVYMEYGTSFDNTPTLYDHGCVLLYNLKTRSFKQLLEANVCKADNGKKQLMCYNLDTDRYGDGTRTDELYDYDGNLISKSEVELEQYNVVPTGTLAAREQARITQEQQANRLSLWECTLCNERVPSKGKPSNVGCKYLLGHSWRRVSYLE